MNTPVSNNGGINTGDMRNTGNRRDRGDRRGSFIKKLLGFSFVLLIIAIAFAAYVTYSGTNLVSNNNIDINLVGPVTSPAGEELSLDVDVTNRPCAH
jgi:zona occludens toxin (predicted ATPase)